MACRFNVRKVGAGFTVIELLISAVILATLASVALPFAELAYRRSQEAELRHALQQIREALDSYKQAGDNGHIERRADQSGYPARLGLLTDGVVDLKSPSGARIYFLRRLPRNPLSRREVSAEDSWAKRSYASSADDPKDGDDVFDVYTPESMKGLNGIPYREW